MAGLCHFVFSSRNTATRKTKRRHATRRNNAMRNERRNNATRKDEITKPVTRKVEIPTWKDEKTSCEKTPFQTVNLSSFRAALFVFSFYFSRGVISGRKDKKAQTSHHNYTIFSVWRTDFTFWCICLNMYISIGTLRNLFRLLSWDNFNGLSMLRIDSHRFLELCSVCCH